MNVYDFDHTIYAGDSSIDFTLFVMRRHPWLLVLLPVQVFSVLGIRLKLISVKCGKELFFSFLKFHPAAVEELDLFWETHQKKMAPWYWEQQKPDDLIISASPAFLLEPWIVRHCRKELIATEMDPLSGKISSENCKGYEKVRLLAIKKPISHIEKFYSDSLSDTPLAQLAEKAFLVRNCPDGTAQFTVWPERFFRSVPNRSDRSG